MSFISGSGLAGDITSGLGFATGAGESAIAPTPPTGTSGVGLPTGKAEAIASAASKYNVPINILVGVYGQETSFGSDVTTSSAGAVGPFQFIPSTASSYAYPLTNTPTAAQFQQQADAAAHLLSDLYKRTGSWDSALHSYSGGGYGLSQVTAQANKAPSWLQGILNSTGFTTTPLDVPAQTVASAITSPLQAVEAIFTWITTPAHWLKVFEAIAGAIAIFLAIKSLTGIDTHVTEIATKAAAVAA